MPKNIGSLGFAYDHRSCVIPPGLKKSNLDSEFELIAFGYFHQLFT